MAKFLKSGIADTEAQYKRLGLTKTVENREDGTRTNGAKGTYEWWYFDSHMEDGTKLVIVIYTKRMMTPNAELSPYATVDLDTPDGGHYEERVEIPGITYSASKNSCDIKVGDCYFKGNPQEGFEIYFKNPVIEAKATLKPSVSAWRPETGHIFFGDNDEDYFAWLPSVPEGKVSAEISLNGNKTQHVGTGYHDHNWGNKNMMKLMNHWYWGRAKIGEYGIISSYITGEKKYGYQTYPIFMLSKNGEILADNGKFLTYTETDKVIEPQTGKPVHNTLIYDYNDGERHYRVTYKREDSIINFKMIEQLKGITKFAAKLIGFDGAYHRFFGVATVDKFENDTVIESVTAPALWELMYFGKTQKK